MVSMVQYFWRSKKQVLLKTQILLDKWILLWLSLTKLMNTRPKSWMKLANVLFGTRHSKYQSLHWWVASILAAKIKMFWQMIWLVTAPLWYQTSAKITLWDSGIKYITKMRSQAKSLSSLTMKDLQKINMYSNQWNISKTSRI